MKTNWLVEEFVTCPTCMGSGVYEDAVCRDCDGFGGERPTKALGSKGRRGRKPVYITDDEILKIADR